MAVRGRNFERRASIHYSMKRHTPITEGLLAAHLPAPLVKLTARIAFGDERGEAPELVKFYECHRSHIKRHTAWWEYVGCMEMVVTVPSEHWPSAMYGALLGG